MYSFAATGFSTQMLGTDWNEIDVLCVPIFSRAAEVIPLSHKGLFPIVKLLIITS